MSGPVSNIEITFPDGVADMPTTGMGVEVKLDGQPVGGLRSIDLRVAYDEVVVAHLEVVAAVKGVIEVPAGEFQVRAVDGESRAVDIGNRAEQWAVGYDGELRVVDVSHAGSKRYREWALAGTPAKPEPKSNRNDFIWLFVSGLVAGAVVPEILSYWF